MADHPGAMTRRQGRGPVEGVRLQNSKRVSFDGCAPLQYHDTILDQSAKNQFLQQNRKERVCAQAGTRARAKDNASSPRRSDGLKRPNIAAPTGNGGAPISASERGARCERIIARMAMPGTISRTIMPAQEPIAGGRMASAASATAIKPSVSRSLFGMVTILFSRSDSSV